MCSFTPLVQLHFFTLEYSKKKKKKSNVYAMGITFFLLSLTASHLLNRTVKRNGSLIKLAAAPDKETCYSSTKRSRDLPRTYRLSGQRHQMHEGPHQRKQAVTLGFCRVLGGRRESKHWYVLETNTNRRVATLWLPPPSGTQTWSEPKTQSPENVPLKHEWDRMEHTHTQRALKI